MTREQFNELWRNGEEIETSGYNMPDVNFGSFPEPETGVFTEGVFTEGVFYGVHFGFEHRETMYDNMTTCMFALDSVGDIQRRKDAHGDQVYLVKMVANPMFPVFEYNNGLEYRGHSGANCIFRRVKI